MTELEKVSAETMRFMRGKCCALSQHVRCLGEP
jgi:hypothetical protein